MAIDSHNSFIFEPKRLREAREACGKTITDLAELIGTTHQCISRYENGKTVPKPDKVRELSRILGFPYTFFFKPKKIDGEETIYFRSFATATKKSKKIHEIRNRWIQEIHVYLEHILEFPSVDIPKFGRGPSYTPTRFREIDQVAALVRRHWGLGEGPISNMLLLLEKKGAIVSRSDFDDDVKIDACSYWGNNDRPYILLGSDNRGVSRSKNHKSSAVRSRFDLAHELGHLVLHADLKPSELGDKKNHKVIEKEANRFASAFLLPSSTFGMEVFNNIDHLIELKKRWKVSISAMAYRAKNLELFTDDQYIYLMKKMNKEKILYEEPLDDELPFEQPQVLSQSIEMILEHNVKSAKQLIEEIGFPIHILEKLVNAEPGTFIEAEESTLPTNLVHLKNFRSQKTV
ncbi:ImmA/IrrE family metallo-endopeptidase [Hazenella sp. IB182353]|uniref:helix-turn-helix domain-containing protein n=1 Tax=Polycladospora coralii TaxID=2771432 RepID=UPI001746624B|nr:XRE family transcriptional regulator [Polycladospora coralii]MBS7529432.1 ImmA/IrrE family metallo-endopeptidase [Polycladospora coralii]